MNHNKLQEYTLKNLCHNWPKVLEIGPYGGSFRFDVIDVNRRDRKVKIFEVKTNRSDFLGDEKWERYLDYCDYFAFVCPKGVIKKSDLPEKIGLVYIEKSKSRRSWETDLKHEYIRKSYKLREGENLEGYIKVLEAVASRRANE